MTDSQPIVVVELPAAIVAPSAAAVIAERTSWGDATLTYADYLTANQKPLTDEAIALLIAKRPAVSNELQAYVTANQLLATNSLILESFHNFFGQLVRDRVPVLFRSSPGVDVAPLLTELEQRHKLVIDRGHLVGDKLYYGSGEIEQKLAVAEGLHHWVDGQVDRPVPVLPSIVFAREQLYDKDYWLNPITNTLVGCYTPRAVKLAAVERGELVPVDYYQSVIKSTYFQVCYQVAIRQRTQYYQNVVYSLKISREKASVQERRVQAWVELLDRMVKNGLKGQWRPVGLSVVEQGLVYQVVRGRHK